MPDELPTVAAALEAYAAVADRHDQAATMHAEAYAAAAPEPEAGASAYGVETGPSDD
jgi:hypothetical protein